jgi:uncharacterized protein YoxC
MNAMTPFVQAAIGLVAIAIVAVAIALVRALGRFTKAVDSATEPTGAVAMLLENASRTSAEVRGLVVKLEVISESLAGAAEGIRGVSDRAVQVSSAILDEVEPPVRRAVSLARGVRAGAELLMERWGRQSEERTIAGRAGP